MTTSLPTVLADFASILESRFGSVAVGGNDKGLFVAHGSRILHVRLDEVAERAIVWTEIERPDYSEIPALERAAVELTARMFLTHGVVLSVNGAADLILLGRSVEQDVLRQPEAIQILDTLADQAEQAATDLKKSIRLHDAAWASPLPSDSQQGFSS